MWVNKIRKIKIGDVPIYLYLTKKDYDKIYEKKYLDQTDYVNEKNVYEWFYNNIVGNIKKNELDAERYQEINEADMMQY